MLLCKSPDTSQIFTSLPEGSRAVREGDKPNKVGRAKQLLDKGGTGMGAECHYPGKFDSFTLDKEAVEKTQEDTQEARGAAMKHREHF